MTDLPITDGAGFDAVLLDRQVAEGVWPSVPTRLLRPGMRVVDQPVHPDGHRLPTRVRPVEMAYSCDVPVREGSAEWTVGRWKLWFADTAFPMGYVTGADRRWPVVVGSLDEETRRWIDEDSRRERADDAAS